MITIWTSLYNVQSEVDFCLRKYYHAAKVQISAQKCKYICILFFVFNKINSGFRRYKYKMDIPMNANILISVVTPVYNGERFIRKTYECLCRQTYDNWEWSVVNDGSTDASDSLLQELAKSDARIIYASQVNSGSAKYPRDRAVSMSRGSLILPLDIDDNLADDYLETMFSRMMETDADIVYPEMLFVDTTTGKVTQRLPIEGFDTSLVYRGRDLVKHTMPEWKIGCNGGLYRRKAWINMSYPRTNEPLPSTADEVDERLYQINAERVAFANAKYYYQNYPSSLTNSVTSRFFHVWLITALQLADVVEGEFGHDSEEYRLANLRLLHVWRSLMACYARHHEQVVDAEGMIEELLGKVFHRIDPALLSRTDRIKFLNLCNEKLLFALFCLKYSPRLLWRKVLQHFCPHYYRSTIIRKREEEKVRNQIASSYSHEHSADRQTSPVVVSMFCGNTSSGGLVDRLRGAVSVYQACQETGRSFKLHFTHPFPLTDYLQPNRYDWRIDDDELSFDSSSTERLVLDSQTDTFKEHKQQRAFLNQNLLHYRDKQVHCYTNASCCYDSDFARDFATLFKPSDRLSRHLNEIADGIGQEYITVSARFCNLLGDFNEEVFSQPLEVREQQQLLDSCMNQLNLLQKRHPECRLVVCSDSVTFLQRAREEQNAYVVPGHISHIGNDVPHDYAYYEKTFLDFFTIAHARHAYLLLAPGMHKSGFPYAAALSSGCPYDIIKI